NPRHADEWRRTAARRVLHPPRARGLLLGRLASEARGGPAPRIARAVLPRGRHPLGVARRRRQRSDRRGPARTPGAAGGPSGGGGVRRFRDVLAELTAVAYEAGLAPSEVRDATFGERD